MQTPIRLIPKADPFEGVQYDGSNGEDLATWCEGRYVAGALFTAGGSVKLEPGDWLVKDSSGMFFLAPAEVVQDQFIKEIPA